MVKIESVLGDDTIHVTLVLRANKQSVVLLQALFGLYAVKLVLVAYLSYHVKAINALYELA